MITLTFTISAIMTTAGFFTGYYYQSQKRKDEKIKYNYTKEFADKAAVRISELEKVNAALKDQVRDLTEPSSVATNPLKASKPRRRRPKTNKNQ